MRFGFSNPIFLVLDLDRNWKGEKSIAQQSLQEMAKYLVKSRLRFAINSVVAEKIRLRNLPLLVATGRCATAWRAESEITKTE